MYSFFQIFPQNKNIFSQADESSRRIVGDFLQSSSSFFNRKRSGSVEVSALSASASNTGPSLSVTNPAGSSNSSATETSGKTWKLIKGKVSQAMEDIKLNKQSDARSIYSSYIFNYHSSNIMKLLKV